MRAPLVQPRVCDASVVLMSCRTLKRARCEQGKGSIGEPTLQISLGGGIGHESMHTLDKSTDVPRVTAATHEARPVQDCIYDACTQHNFECILSHTIPPFGPKSLHQLGSQRNDDRIVISIRHIGVKQKRSAYGAQQHESNIQTFGMLGNWSAGGRCGANRYRSLMGAHQVWKT